eukprot:m51a1_g3754 putative C-tail anchored protein, putative Sec61beta subunit (82) ;mRNA; r:78270-78763
MKSDNVPKGVVRHRAPRASSGSSSGIAGSLKSGTSGLARSFMKLYDEESPGLKIGPTTVLVVSLGFICTVVLMHIVGKLRS